MEQAAKSNKISDPERCTQQDSLVMEGCHAASYAAMLARVQVVSAYPITPQTAVVEKLAEFCSRGELEARYIMVESEHSALAGCIGAAAAGARAFTATSSQGLALMHELLHWAAGARLPVVLVNVNRALGPPWNIHCDHQDSISQRDTGWMQFYCESNQDVFDTVLQSFRIAELVSLPCMVNLDAFYLSHTVEPVIVASQKMVDRFLPPRKPAFRLDIDHPQTFGGLAKPDSYMELRYDMDRAMTRAGETIDQVDLEFKRLFGRAQGGKIESYRMTGARFAIVTSATITGNARVAVEEFRERDVPIGLVKIRALRPFPTDAIQELLSTVEAATIIDRSVSFGKGGVLYDEIKSVLYDLERRPRLYGVIAGLGGRDVGPEEVAKICEPMLEERPAGGCSVWHGLNI